MDCIGLSIVLEIGVKDVPIFGAAWPLCLPDISSVRNGGGSLEVYL